MTDPNEDITLTETNEETNEENNEENNEVTVLGRSGFSNLGNSCYLNTALQALFHIQPLGEAILARGLEILEMAEPPADPLWVCPKDKSVPREELDREFLASFLNLYKAYWEENCEISPVSFYRVFIRRFPAYVPFSQNDSSEVLLYIIDHLHDSLAQPLKVRPLFNERPTTRFEYRRLLAARQWHQYFKYKTSPIVDYLTGQEHQRLQCQHCKNINHRYVTFNHLALSLNISSHRLRRTDDTIKKARTDIDHINLYNLIDRYCAKEQLDVQNQWQCDICGTKTQAYRKTTFRNLPQFLIVVLKRFSQQLDGSVVKQSTAISYPLVNLDLNPYVTEADHILPKYDLISVGCHRGHTEAGHYYSYAKTSDGRFNLFNDEFVQLVQEYADVISRDAYFLIYERQ